MPMETAVSRDFVAPCPEGGRPGMGWLAEATVGTTAATIVETAAAIETAAGTAAARSPTEDLEDRHADR